MRTFVEFDSFLQYVKHWKMSEVRYVSYESGDSLIVLTNGSDWVTFAGENCYVRQIAGVVDYVDRLVN